MDAHKNSITVAAWLPEQAEPVEWTEDTTAEAIRRLGRKLRRLAPGEVRACYEAGPTGYGLQRSAYRVSSSLRVAVNSTPQRRR
jgi:hypothetical protein